jgi:hypothetical protein
MARRSGTGGCDGIQRLTKKVARISVATIPVEGRDLSSRQTQDVVKDLRDWAIYQLRNCSTAKGIARERRREVLSEEPAGDLHVRFDERNVETESSLKAPPDERGGNRYVLPKPTTLHLDSATTENRFRHHCSG